MYNILPQAHLYHIFLITKLFVKRYNTSNINWYFFLIFIILYYNDISLSIYSQGVDLPLRNGQNISNIGLIL